MKTITILVPAYNEEEALPLFYAEISRLAESLTSYAWDLLFVDDGSTDGTADALRRLREADTRVRYLRLSRNFGKENAMLAGFDYAEGDATIVMDCDLQDPVDVIPQMLQAWEEGFEDVYARRVTRGREPLLRKWLTRAYYALLQRSSRFDVLPNVGDFRLLDRRCIDALRQLRETQRYTKGMYSWIGFRKHEVWFEQQDRFAGSSTFNFSRLLNLAIDGITSFTTAPLRLATYLGLVVSVVAFLYMCYILVTTLIWGDPVAGYPTMMTVMLFLGGVQLLSLGIIGEYLGRIFYETKCRPVYLVGEASDDCDERP